MHPLAGETLITLGEAARRYPGKSPGQRLQATSVMRRIVKGNKNPATGELVKLEAIRDGNRWLTSEEALARYHAALARVLPLPRAESATRKKKRQDRVNAELDRLGL